MNKIWSLHSPSSCGENKQTMAEYATTMKEESSPSSGMDSSSYKRNIKLGFLFWFPTHKLKFWLWIACCDKIISVWFLLVGNIFLPDLTTKLTSTLECSTGQEKCYTNTNDFFFFPIPSQDWGCHRVPFLLYPLHPLLYFVTFQI